MLSNGENNVLKTLYTMRTQIKNLINYLYDILILFCIEEHTFSYVVLET